MPEQLRAPTPASGAEAAPASAAAPTRRAVIRTVAATGGAAATVAFLAACTGDAGDDGATDAVPAEPVELPAAEVPVGGGAVLTAHHLVVTQPTSGDYRAFSAICTHQGCPVSSVEDRGVYCACHSSYFDIASGNPVAGPATTALTSVPVALDGETLVIG